MSVLYFLLPLALVIAAVAVGAFVWVPDFVAVRGACVLVLLAAGPLLRLERGLLGLQRVDQLADVGLVGFPEQRHGGGGLRRRAESPARILAGGA